MADGSDDNQDDNHHEGPVDPATVADHIAQTVIPSLVEETAKTGASDLATLLVGFLGTTGFSIAPDLMSKGAVLLAAALLYGFNWLWKWERIKRRDARLRAAVVAPAAVPVTRVAAAKAS